MKIIFLDIDGVLNGYNKWNLLGWKIVSTINYKPLISLYRKLVDPFNVHESKVKKLSKIINKTNAKIVLSSSWRYGWWKIPYAKQSVDHRKLTDLFIKYNIEIIDITPTKSTRGEEINEWLFEHKDVTNYIILDDEDYDMGIFKNDKRFIKTSNGTYKGIIISGLKNKHVNYAIKILEEDK